MEEKSKKSAKNKKYALVLGVFAVLCYLVSFYVLTAHK